MKKTKFQSNQKEIKKSNNAIKANNTSPKNIKFFKMLVKDTNYQSNLIVFKSIFNYFILVYTDKNESIIAYDLTTFNKISEIKNSQKYIVQLNYCFDNKNKRDLIASISTYLNNIKLWDINTLELILDFNYNIGNFYFDIDSICFFHYKNNIHLVASNAKMPNNLLIHIYDLNGKKVKELNYNYRANLVSTFYDEKHFKNYIIIATNDDIRSIDFEENKIFKKYISIVGKSQIKSIKLNEEERKKLGLNQNFIIKQEIPLKGPTKRIIVKDYNNITKLFAAENDGFVRIWNFHTGKLLSAINISKSQVFDISLWNEEYLFAGHTGGAKLVDLNNNKVIKNFDEKGDVKSMAIYDIKEFGKCLIIYNSKGIFLFINKVH